MQVSPNMKRQKKAILKKHSKPKYNEKIEGFFDICMRKDPKAFYGVIIPQSNVKHLMLKSEVLKAVKRKKFAIYAVKSIGEGIQILTAVKADKVNNKVTARLEQLSLHTKNFYHTQHDKDL